MLFMVIERFKNQDPIPVYRRVRDPGIKFPEGLTYVGSWIEPNFDRCFQLMECDDLRLLQEWVLANNRDLGMTFEIVPVVPEQGNAGSRRAVPRRQIATPGFAGPARRWSASSRCRLIADVARPQPLRLEPAIGVAGMTFGKNRKYKGHRIGDDETAGKNQEPGRIDLSTRFNDAQPGQYRQVERQYRVMRDIE